ncbi:MAG: insulinase family protein [Deltaproteobacteria bacterium]|nr:insulinase family protein [Deltaproteobacteria bacterium]
MQRNIEEIKHHSGLTVLFEPANRFQTLSINCWFQVGSSDELPGQYGQAHFLEHMLFTGSHQKNNVEMMQSLQEVGGYSNAFTTYDHTGYECVVPIEHAEKGFEWIQQVILEPVFDQVQIRKEKKVILEEYTDGLDQPEIVFEEKFWQKVYQNQTLALPILGQPADIEAVTAESLQAFYACHYQPSQMVLSICGNLSREQVDKWLAQYVIPFLGSKQQDVPPLQPCRFAPVRFDYQGGHQQRKLAYLFAGVPTLHQDVMALELLSACLGGGEYSHLFQDLRQDKQWVSHVQAHLFISRGGGHFGIELVPFQDRVDDVQTHIENMLIDFAWITDDMIKWAKKDLEKEVLYSLDSSWGRSKLNVYFGLVFADVYQQQQYYQDLQKLTRDDLQTVFEKYLQKPYALGYWKAKDD